MQKFPLRVNETTEGCISLKQCRWRYAYSWIVRQFVLRLYYEIETYAKAVMLAYGNTISTANNANSVNMCLNGLRDTLLESQKHAEVNRTSDNYRQLTWLTLIITIN